MCTYTSIPVPLNVYSIFAPIVELSVLVDPWCLVGSPVQVDQLPSHVNAVFFIQPLLFIASSEITSFIEFGIEILTSMDLLISIFSLDVAVTLTVPLLEFIVNNPFSLILARLVVFP